MYTYTIAKTELCITDSVPQRYGPGDVLIKLENDLHDVSIRVDKEAATDIVKHLIGAFNIDIYDIA